ncbi:hypothetical protein N9N67_05695 [Bacteriovoracaceae bacterium]|nr:hypothetical protein [Bacteriovoracaceae bacterium]
MLKHSILIIFLLVSFSSYSLKYRCPYVGGEADNEIFIDTHFKLACLSDNISCDTVELSKVNYLKPNQTILIFSGVSDAWGKVNIHFNLTQMSAAFIHNYDEQVESKLYAKEACFTDPSIIL